ncbi:MAG: aspartate carbamoyltransferase [Candidatus Micrarchaeota archaeon]|nr:aspartate carbamoyltransferase [Candidatus Micrarchaeota archaeon]
MQDLISIRDLDKKEIELYLKEASRMEKMLSSGQLSLLKGCIVANMFFEPSTRTNMSFQAAAKRLGAKVLTFHHSTSSTAKGETFADTVRMMDGYADALVIRHSMEGAARFAADLASNPVINAGDGGNQHPTQTLIDLYTILKLKGKIEGLNVTLLGDLKHARTMRSLLYGLSMFGAEVTLCSPEQLKIDPEIISEVKEKFGAKPTQTSKIDLAKCDVLYVCRIQKERFSDPYEAERMQKEFRVDLELLSNAPKNLAVLHPLPKIDEIPPELDSTQFAKYFEQAKNGVPVRMAVLYRCIRG